ncbi:hypothetical protein BUE80_DR004491, partial [Diplocarpon rosae]
YLIRGGQLVWYESRVRPIHALDEWRGCWGAGGRLREPTKQSSNCNESAKSWAPGSSNTSRPFSEIEPCKFRSSFTISTKYYLLTACYRVHGLYIQRRGSALQFRRWNQSQICLKL